MTEADGAWMARVIARFSDEDIAAAVSVGKYDLASTRYLIETLITRRDRILRRYFQKLSPIADLEVRGDALCGVDLGLLRHVVSERSEPRTLAAGIRSGDALEPIDPRSVQLGERGAFCVDLSGQRVAEADRGSDPRYMIVELNGGSELALRAHLYDLGRSTALRLVGIERE
jgi:hypothetical protein